MQADKFLQRLETVRGTLAHQALETPGARDEFEYGRACGMYSGLSLAIETITEMIEEDAKARA